MAGIGATVALIKALAPKADPAVITQAVEDYLEAHPEISVADGSITEAKLAADVAGILEDLQDDVIEIQGNLEHTVPDYWETMLTTKEASINDINNEIGANGVTFLYFTDYHQNTNNGKSLNLMLHVLDHTSVSEVVYGGDTTDGGLLPDVPSAEAMMRRMANYWKPLKMLPVRGNHDCEPSAGQATNQISDSAYYDMYVRPVEHRVETTGKAYYHMDNEGQKVRYIIMDSGSSINLALDATQIAWLKSRLTELESGWTVVIFQHIMYEGVGTQSQTIKTQGTALLTAIDDVYANLDCTIAAIITGHSHADAIIPTNFPVPVIVTTCDSGGANAEYDPVNPTRTAGTTLEQAFDVFSIDTLNKNIKITRIGAGSDRETTYTGSTFLEPHMLFHWYFTPKNTSGGDPDGVSVDGSETASTYGGTFRLTGTGKYAYDSESRLHGEHAYPIMLPSGATAIKVTVPNQSIKVAAYWCDSTQASTYGSNYIKCLQNDGFPWDQTVPAGTRTISVPSISGIDSFYLSVYLSGTTLTQEMLDEITVEALFNS